MANNKIKFILEEYEDKFEFKNDKSKLNLRFNRIAFIFFIFFSIFLIYSIHLLHLGSRKSSIDINKTDISSKIHRSDIIDRNGNFIAKTVGSIDIGINPSEVIDKKKLLINLKYIFPNKDYKAIKAKLKNNKFFWFEKKISEENYEKMMM